MLRVGDVVKVKAEEPGVFYEVFVCTVGEGSGEGDVVEFGLFVHFGLLWR